MAAKYVKILLGCYRTGEANDPETYTRAATALLGDYPEEVIQAVCDPRHGIPSKLKWLPSIAELKEACEVEMRPIYRRQEQDRMANDRRRALAAPATARPTIDELREKFGEKWGINDEDTARRSRWVPPTIDELCAQAGVSRAEFERVNAEAVEMLRKTKVAL